MLKGTIEVEGKDKHDIVLALEKVIMWLNRGCRSGHDANEDGEYSFNISQQD